MRHTATHPPVQMLDDESVCLGSRLGKPFLCHLTTVFHTPLQQEALVGFEQLQLMGLLQLLLPDNQGLSESANIYLFVCSFVFMYVYVLYFVLLCTMDDYTVGVLLLHLFPVSVRILFIFILLKLF